MYNLHNLFILQIRTHWSVRTSGFPKWSWAGTSTVLTKFQRIQNVKCRKNTWIPSRIKTSIWIFLSSVFFWLRKQLLKLLSRSPHMNNQCESRIFATDFCLVTLLVNIGKIKILNKDQNTSKNANITLYTLCNTLNWGNWKSGFIKLGVQW